MRGTRREPIGVTPLQWEAEFHSEISVLRLRFERPGYGGKTVEISAAQDELVVALEAKPTLADPGVHREPALREAQQRANRALEGALPELFAQWPGWRLEIRRAARMIYLDPPKMVLHVPVLATPSKEDAASKELAQKLWDGPGKAITGAIAAKLKHRPEVSAVLLDARVAAVDRRFAVGSAMESRVEMVCVPGVQQVFDACATRVPEVVNECRGTSCITRTVGTKCMPGMKPVHDPCATRAPVTKTELKIKPQAATSVASKRIYLYSPLQGTPALLQLDETGKRVYERGVVPAPVLAGVGAD